MNLSALAGALLVHLALTAGLLGFLAVLRSAAPDFAARSALEADRRPWRSLALGVGILLLELAILGAAERAGSKGLALFALALFALALLFGALAAASALGERLGSQLGRAPSPLGGLALGWLALASLALVPLAGWLILATALVTGIGAAVRTLLASSNSKPEKGGLP